VDLDPQDADQRQYDLAVVSSGIEEDRFPNLEPQGKEVHPCGQQLQQACEQDSEIAHGF